VVRGTQGRFRYSAARMTRSSVRTVAVRRALMESSSAGMSGCEALNVAGDLTPD